MSTAISNRLKRISGQVLRLEDQISNKEVCDNVIPQFLAVRGALNSALLAYLKESIESCEKSDRDTLERLLAHLIK